jgi:hypothetical protein
VFSRIPPILSLLGRQDDPTALPLGMTVDDFSPTRAFFPTCFPIDVAHWRKGDHADDLNLVNPPTGFIIRMGRIRPKKNRKVPHAESNSACQ